MTDIDAARALIANRRLSPHADHAMTDQADALLDEVERLRERVAKYEGAITWDTTCLNCSRLLDRCYQADAERDEARAEMDRLSGLLDAIRGTTITRLRTELRGRVAEIDALRDSWDRVADRAEKAESAIARIEALCDDYDNNVEPYEEGHWFVSVPRIRAALRGEPQ
jgi:hypothetical protein